MGNEMGNTNASSMKGSQDRRKSILLQEMIADLTVLLDFVLFSQKWLSILLLLGFCVGIFLFSEVDEAKAEAHFQDQFPDSSLTDPVKKQVLVEDYIAPAGAEETEEKHVISISQDHPGAGDQLKNRSSHARGKNSYLNFCCSICYLPFILSIFEVS